MEEAVGKRRKRETSHHDVSLVLDQSERSVCHSLRPHEPNEPNKEKLQNSPTLSSWFGPVSFFRITMLDHRETFGQKHVAAV